MTAEQIEAFKTRIEPYLEKESDKIELAVICRCAAAYMEHVEKVVDRLDRPDTASERTNRFQQLQLHQFRPKTQVVPG